MRELLDAKRPVIESIRRTSSLRPSAGAKGLLIEGSVKDAGSVDANSEEFSFDYELFSSKVYRNALRSYLRDQNSSSQNSQERASAIQDDTQDLIDLSSSRHSITLPYEGTMSVIDDLRDLNMRQDSIRTAKPSSLRSKEGEPDDVSQTSILPAHREALFIAPSSSHHQPEKTQKLSTDTRKFDKICRPILYGSH